MKKTKMNVCVKLTVALLTVFALVAGMPQVTMAKKKAKAEASAKSSKSEKASSKEKAESKISKADAEAKELVSDLTSTQKKKLLSLLNDGDLAALTAITGVGEVRAKAILKGRPFDSIEDLREVEGVGNKVFGDVVAYGKNPSESAKPTKSKTASKKSSSSKKKKTS